jgi:hypothetical protein
MLTREIPHDEWAEFLDELSDQDDTVLVSVEITGEDLGDQIVASGLRLQGLTLVQKGSEAGEIEIILGDTPQEHVSHVVRTPTRLTILETDEGEPQTLQIEAAGDPTTLVHFQTLVDDALLDDEDEEDE